MKTGKIISTALLTALLLCVLCFAVTAWIVGVGRDAGGRVKVPEYDLDIVLSSYEYNDRGEAIGYRLIETERYELGELLYGDQRVIWAEITNRCSRPVEANLMFDQFLYEEKNNPLICFFRVDVYLEDPMQNQNAQSIGGEALCRLTGSRDILTDTVTLSANDTVSLYCMISRIGANDIYRMYEQRKSELNAAGGYGELLTALNRCATSESYDGFVLSDYKKTEETTADVLFNKNADEIYTLFQAYNYEINEVPFQKNVSYLLVPALLVSGIFDVPTP